MEALGLRPGLAQTEATARLRRVRRIGAWLLVASTTALAACGARGDAHSPAAGAQTRTPPPVERPRPTEPSSEQVPVDADDGVWGDALAPVTVVVFTDLQCPYCAHAHATLAALEHHYGEARLRVVIKHTPLARHGGAVPAARVAQAILALNGRRRFFEYLDLAFSRQSEVADGRAVDLAGPLEVDLSAIAERASDRAVGEQILRDAQLADRLRITGTPHHRINGLAITGTVPLAEFTRWIEEEQRAAAALRAAGVPADAIYARRVSANFSRTDAEP